jgi:hypothetical protein
MSVATARSELAIEVSVDGADPGEIMELTSQLRDSLLELDVEAVYAPSKGAAPEGSKGVESLQLGSLIVQLLLQEGVLESVIRVLKSWLGHRPDRSVKVTLGGDSLELTGATSAQVSQLVEVWVKRHAGSD